MASAKSKLHGRAFYESLGSPKYIIAPMVDQSEFAWRLLTRSFLPPELRSSILAYSPMLHAKLFAESPKYRPNHFEPLKPPLVLAAPGDQEHVDRTIGEDDLYLDGNKNVGDRPLFVQFCANSPDALLDAAKIVQPFCDAVDLNLGCPQGIAKRGQYGAFLQEQPDLIFNMINKLHKELDIPVTAKMRILDTPEKTLTYAKTLLDAGASILTVHGRQRHQKGHLTGLADWSMLRYLRNNLPPETVIFANGNVLQHSDLQECLDATEADGVMTAEGNLYDPTIFAEPPPAGEEGSEYFRGRDGRGGFRMDAVLRRYLDIIHKYVLGHELPTRKPLFVLSDLTKEERQKELDTIEQRKSEAQEGQPPNKKQKREETGAPKDQQKGKKEQKKVEKVTKANMVAMQAHCFHMLRALVSEHHNVRDALARSRAGDIEAYENVLTLTEEAVKEGLLKYDRNPAEFEASGALEAEGNGDGPNQHDPTESSYEAVRRCHRPWFVCQARVRPLPKEALEKGSIQLSKKELKRAAEKEKEAQNEAKATRVHPPASTNGDANGDHSNGEAAPLKDVPSEGWVEKVDPEVQKDLDGVDVKDEGNTTVPRGGMVCG